MRPMRLRAASCVAVVAAALVLAGVTGAAGTASFSDPAGDSGVAPDITSVAVANDDQGLITFRVTVANRAALSTDEAVAIPLATNAPGKAGVRDDGVNFVLGLEGTKVFLQKWNGAGMVEIRPTSLRGSFAAGSLTAAVRQDDLAPGFPSLALPTELSFYVLGVAFKGDTVVGEDDAPDATDQFWTYRLVQPPRIVVTYFRAPKAAKAGMPVVARLGAAWSDTGRVARPTKVSCRAKLGNQLLRGTSGAAGYATCSWAVPKRAAKILTGTITLTNGATVVSRSFSTRVR